MARKNPRIEQLEREVNALRKMLTMTRQEPGDLPCTGCGDNSCIVKRPTGQATNGGCRCESAELRRALMWYKSRTQFLEQTVSELRMLVPHDAS